jgi:FixJ family two-component response regulator
MPDKEGLETIRELHNEFGKVKIVAMTGGSVQFSQVDFLNLAKKCGAFSTLQKPFEARAFVGAVKEILAAQVP